MQIVRVAIWLAVQQPCGLVVEAVKQLPYQAVMQPVLSMVQLYNFLRFWGPMPNIFNQE